MLNRLNDAFVSAQFQVGLVERIADNEHVINAYADQEERHQFVHACFESST